MEGVVKPDFVRNSSEGHFFCLRRGSGTEAGGRAAFRRRVAGDREMAPDTKLHPGQFAFALRPSERHASGTSFAFGSGKREFSWLLRRAVERPFVRCSGNDSKVAFRPGRWKGVSSRNSQNVVRISVRQSCVVWRRCHIVDHRFAHNCLTSGRFCLWYATCHALE